MQSHHLEIEVFRYSVYIILDYYSNDENLERSDHEEQAVVSVERSGEDPSIGGALHRLVHMDVLLMFLSMLIVFIMCYYEILSLFNVKLASRQQQTSVHLEIGGGEVLGITSFARLPNQTRVTLDDMKMGFL